MYYTADSLENIKFIYLQIYNYDWIILNNFSLVLEAHILLSSFLHLDSTNYLGKCWIKMAHGRIQLQGLRGQSYKALYDCNLRL